jgi:alcohol dehydrogenase class IV
LPWLAPFIDFHIRTRVVFGYGTLARLTALAGELGFSRTLVVADEGIVATGYVDTVAALPMLLSIGIPTTAGTGSEAPQYAIISDRRHT